MGCNCTGQPCSVGRPTAHAPGPLARRQHYRRRQTTVNKTIRRASNNFVKGNSEQKKIAHCQHPFLDHQLTHAVLPLCCQHPYNEEKILKSRQWDIWYWHWTMYEASMMAVCSWQGSAPADKSLLTCSANRYLHVRHGTIRQ